MGQAEALRWEWAGLWPTAQCRYPVLSAQEKMLQNGAFWIGGRN